MTFAPVGASVIGPPPAGHGLRPADPAAGRRGVRLLHHDAEQGASLLPGLVGRADLVLFPVDCVSHDAVLAVKRLCRRADRPFRALRSAGVASLLAALAGRDSPAG